MKAGALRVVASAAAILFAVGCVNLEAPTQPPRAQLVIHAVLDLSRDAHSILIYRSQNGAQSPNTSGFTDEDPVAGAVVTITAPDGTVMTAYATDPETGQFFPTGTYVLEPRRFGVALLPGGTYSLHVQTTLGEEVTGATSIPKAQPNPGFSPNATVLIRARDTLRLSWPRVSGAHSYELNVNSPVVDYRMFADTSVALAGTALTIAGDEIFARGVGAFVLVSAVDANYYDYYRAQSDPFAGAAPSHLKGAVGVFGSLVPILGTRIQVQ
jgi:hypothetical protein